MPNVALWLVAYTPLGAEAALAVSGAISAIGPAIATIGISTAISRALAPKLPPGSLSSGSPIDMTQDPAPVGRGIYGTVRVSGPIAFAATKDTEHADNGELYMTIPLAIHQIDGFEDTCWLANRPVTFTGTEADGDFLGWFSRYNLRLGADDQAANAVFVSQLPTLQGVNHRLRGVAVADVRLSHPEDPTELFPGGLPNPVSFLVRGARVYDPRDEDHDPDDPSTWVYSANPALCLLDYLTNDYYGLGVSLADEIDLDSFIAAANICDEDVDGEPRYECHGTWETSAEPLDVIEMIRATMAGELYYIDGTWILHAGAARTAESVGITVDDLRGSVEVQGCDELQATCNIVRGTFTFPADGYVPRDYPEAKSSVYIAEDDGYELPRQLNLPWVQSAKQAQRIAWIELKKARQDISVTWDGLSTLDRYRVGDIVPVTFGPTGFSTKQFLVQKQDLVLIPPENEGEGPGIGVNVSLREYSSTFFDDEEPGDIDPAPNTTLPPAFPGEGGGSS